MKLIFLKPADTKGVAKVTIHFNGKTGFSSEAMKILSINENKYVKIAKDENAKDYNTLFMVITEKNDGEAFKVNKAGNYFYLSTKQLYDEMKFDYENKKIIFDIKEINYEGQKIFELKRREIDRKK